jgi:sugar lactone lactonase YvrE
VNSRDEILVAEIGANGSRTGAAVKRVSRDGTVEPLISGNGLRDPIGIAVDEDDNVYVANWGTGEIYRSDGETTTLFAEIGGNVNQIAYGEGYLYVPSPSLRKIFRVDREGNVEHIAGTGARGTTDGPALEATFGRPNSIAVGTDGRTLYIIDADAQSVRVLHPASGTNAEADPRPAGFDLRQNYPNPVRDVSRIGFTLPESGHVRLSVFDLLGREVRVLVDGVRAAGPHEAHLDASGLPAGSYVCRLEMGGRTIARLVTVVR